MAMRAGVPLFFLIGHTTHALLARNFINGLERVLKFLDEHEPPFIARIYRPSPVSRGRGWLGSAAWNLTEGHVTRLLPGPERHGTSPCQREVGGHPSRTRCLTEPFSRLFFLNNPSGKARVRFQARKAWRCRQRPAEAFPRRRISDGRAGGEACARTGFS